MNTPTPTPRTDAATYPADCLGQTLVTNRDCARELERELTALTAERDQLHLGAELDEALQLATERSLKTAIARAERAEAEAERYRLVTLRLDAELASERARLDWLMAGGMCLVQHSGGFHVCRLNCQVSRAAIDLGMKEDAK